MSRLLVFLQFALIGLIAYPHDAPALTTFNVMLFGIGLMVFFAAFSAMRLRSFSVMPEPKAGGELVTRGIYSRVRHPMYLAVLLCVVAACLAYATWEKWLMAALLAGVLIAKMRREEKMLLNKFESYAAYRKRTKAIVPFVF